MATLDLKRSSLAPQAYALPGVRDIEVRSGSFLFL